MNMSNDSSNGGIGFFGLLTIVFIVLKLTGFISWPWVWVVSPIIAVLLLFLGVVAAVFIFEIKSKKKY